MVRNLNKEVTHLKIANALLKEERKNLRSDIEVSSGSLHGKL
jgi:hypothetical protein